MSILKALYFFAFAICILPNDVRVKNVSYDELQVDLKASKEYINKLQEGSCHLIKREQETITLEEFLNPKEESCGNICDYIPETTNQR